MDLMMRVVKYVPVTVEESEMMTIAQAAALLGLDEGAVRANIARGALTEYVNGGKSYHGRRLLLRSEVEGYALSRKKVTMSEEEGIDKPE